MKRKLIALGLGLCVGTCIVGCNKQVFDTTYSFDKVIIYLPNGEVVEGSIDSWKDFDDGDQLQVKVDGVTYLTHAENVVLIAE